MNEEIEVQNIYNEFELKAGVHIGTEERLIIKAINKGFQKGKLEQKKEELTLLEDLLVKYNSRWLRIRIKEEIKQLQKETSEEKQDE